MRMIKTLIGIAAVLFAYAHAYAIGTDYPLDKAPDRRNNVASLQNGAKIFVNYCLNCHSASAMRYSKLQDIGLTEEQIKKNLLFTGEKISDPMTVALTAADAKKWFGTVPPDLSVIARATATTAGPSGSDYIYTYMRSFYRDTSQPTGWNNLVAPHVGMPHVMWEQQGPRALTTVIYRDVKGQDERVTTDYNAQGFTQIKQEPIANSPRQDTLEAKFKALDPQKAASYDNDVADLTAFLSWMAEPHQLRRKQLGVWVLLFLGLFLLVAWRLNASYWKHIR